MTYGELAGPVVDENVCGVEWTVEGAGGNWMLGWRYVVGGLAGGTAVLVDET